MESPRCNENSLNTLQLMASTLQAAGSMEQMRPSLYQQNPRPDQMISALAHGLSAPNTGTTKPHVNPQTQGLPGEGDSSVTAALSGSNNVSHNGTTDPQVTNGNSTGPVSVMAKKVQKAPLTRTQSDKVTVEFYDEYIGFPMKKRDDNAPSLKPAVSSNKAGNDKKEDKDNDDQQEADGEDMAERDVNNPWGQLKKCRYIRGPLESPELVLPADCVQYVFGEDEAAGNGQDSS